MARGGETVARMLQGYADRGVFRGLTAESLPGGRARFTFTWLTRRPMALHVDREATRLRFVDLLTQVDGRSSMGRDLAALIAARTSRTLPTHRRLDVRRASVEASTRKGAWSLVVTAHGTAHAYAIRYALNLVNDVFLLLHEKYPDYLIEHFGLSAE